jgi:hypothetical protein
MQASSCIMAVQRCITVVQQQPLNGTRDADLFYLTALTVARPTWHQMTRCRQTVHAYMLTGGGPSNFETHW